MSQFEPPRRPWIRKFADAFRGLAMGMRGQSSFAVHIVFAVLVVAAGVWLDVSPTEWRLLILCITVVLSAEMFNSALERLAKALDTRENQHLAAGLNIASGAVLLAALGAAVVGLSIFVPRLSAFFDNFNPPR